MADADPIRKLASKTEAQLGIIPGTKFWTPFPFSGMNQQDVGTALADAEFQYIENFFRLGNGYFRAAFDVGTPLYTTGGNTIISFFWYNIAAIDYVAIFFVDGTALQVRQFDGQATAISAVPGTFYSQGNVTPACVQWGSLYLVISNNNTRNDYWIWDGTNLYVAGTIGPVVKMNFSGRNYTVPPSVNVFGGSGSGIVLTPTISDGGIVNLTVAAGGQGSGYQLGDQLQVQFTGGFTDDEVALIAVLADAGVAGVDVTINGKGYASPPAVTFTRRPWDRATAPVDATGTAVISNGQVKSVTIAPGDEGSYTAQPLVSFSGGGGSGAGGTSFLQSGIVNANGDMMGSVIDVVIFGPHGHGTNYIIAPELQVIGNGEGCLLTAQLTPTSVAYFNILSGGSGMEHGVKSVKISPPPTPPGGVTAAATTTVQNGILVEMALQGPAFGGSGYLSPPTVFIEPYETDYLQPPGGTALNQHSVTLANVEAVLVGTPLDTVLVSAPGQFYTQTPGIFVVPGSNNAASASIELMPFGTSGAAMESFQQQLYLLYPHQQYNIPTGGNFLVSAPESLTDFATSDGGLVFVNSDRFLRKQYVGARQSSGYLYLFGEDSVSVISNPQTQGSPPTTTFNYQNVDPQNGLAWRDTLQDFGRTVIFANDTGVYGLYGGAATKISGKLDNLFDSARFPNHGGLTPSSAVATVFNRRHYFMLMTISDPFTAQPHNVMVTWNEKEWVLTSQTAALTYIGTQEINGDLHAWGTDGRSLFKLFQTPSAMLVKMLVTKVYGNDQPILYKQYLALYLQAQDRSGLGIAFSTYLNSSGIVIPPPSQVIGGISDSATVPGLDLSSSQPLNIPANFVASPPYFPLFGTAFTEANYGMLAMLTLATQSPDFILSNLLVAYRDHEAFIG